MNENITEIMKDLQYDNHSEIMQKIIDMVEKHKEKILFLESQLKGGANKQKKNIKVKSFRI